MTQKMTCPMSHKMSHPMTHGMTREMWLHEVAMTLVNSPKIKFPQQKKTQVNQTKKETYHNERNYSTCIIHNSKR